MLLDTRPCVLMLFLCCARDLSSYARRKCNIDEISRLMLLDTRACVLLLLNTRVCVLMLLNMRACVLMLLHTRACVLMLSLCYARDLLSYARK